MRPTESVMADGPEHFALILFGFRPDKKCSAVPAQQ
jgi:hypothetical protein